MDFSETTEELNWAAQFGVLCLQTETSIPAPSIFNNYFHKWAKKIAKLTSFYRHRASNNKKLKLQKFTKEKKEAFIKQKFSVGGPGTIGL